MRGRLEPDQMEDFSRWSTRVQEILAGLHDVSKILPGELANGLQTVHDDMSKSTDTFRGLKSIVLSRAVTSTPLRLQ